MRRESHFCTFIKFRIAWGVKIYRDISPRVFTSWIRDSGFPNQTHDYVCQSFNSLWSLASSKIKSWAWSAAFSASPLHEVRASLKATKKILWLLHLVFNLITALSFSLLTCTVSMYFRNNHPIPLSLYFSSPPTHFKCLSHPIDFYIFPLQTYHITCESFTSWHATLFWGLSIHQLPPGIGSSLPAREWANQLLHPTLLPAFLDPFWHQQSQIGFLRKQMWAWLGSAKVYEKEHLWKQKDRNRIKEDKYQTTVQVWEISASPMGGPSSRAKIICERSPENGQALLPPPNMIIS